MLDILTVVVFFGGAGGMGMDMQHIYTVYTYMRWFFESVEHLAEW